MDDGWNDDDDIDLDLYDVNDATIPDDAVAKEVPERRRPPSTQQEVVVADGWDDFGDLDDDDEDYDDKEGEEEEVDYDKGGFQAQDHFAASAAPAVPQPSSTPTDKRGGWEEDEEDDDLNFDDNGWGDDDAAIDEAIADNDGLPTTEEPSPPSRHPISNHLLQELDGYVRSLDRMLSSINAVLEFEYNTPEKAQELVDYYSSRPQLAEYTINKELQRMNYQVVLPHGHVETDKQRIVDYNLLSEESLVSRASNQSLLADLLHVITGPDLIVRPQYLAICVANWCQFTIHLGDGQDLVQCQAKLRLSLPTMGQGDRLDIAEVGVAVVFAPSQPMVEYKVHRIDVLLQEPSQLEGSVQFLAAMEGHWDEMPEIAENERLQNAPADVFRDQFLVNSQRFLSQSTLGMKSALNQVDSVINVRGKLQAISNFIPATDIMLAAEQEAMELAEARRQEMERRQHQHHHQQTQTSHLFPRPQPPPPQTAPDSGNRPKSILGSLFGAVAQSVALPDEDDAAIFGAVSPPQPPQQQPVQQESLPHLYRKDDDTPSASTFPKLYRREEKEETSPEPAQTRTSGLPSLYRKEEPTPTRPQRRPPTLYRRDEEPNISPLNEPHLPTISQPFGRYEDPNPLTEREEAEVVADGWDDDAPLDFNDDNVPMEEPKESVVEAEKLEVLEDGWDDIDAADVAEAVVDEDADIGPTRKRFLNPRPNRPYVYGLGC